MIRSIIITDTDPPACCSRCGAPLPDGAEGCRTAFYAILAREFSDPAYGAVNLLTVDAHALQHPEDHGVKNNAFHLLRLCWLLEYGGDPRLGKGPHWLQRHFEGDVDVPALDPPIQRGAVTVVDVLDTDTPQEHSSQVRRWAESVWEAWRDHHDWARQWIQAQRQG